MGRNRYYTLKFFLCINKGQAELPSEIKLKSICVDADIAEMITVLKDVMSWLYRQAWEQIFRLSDIVGRAMSRKDRITIGKAFIRIAEKYGMTIRPCAEGNELAEYGADCSGCMTVKTFETALSEMLDVPKRKTNQRNGERACWMVISLEMLLTKRCKRAGSIGRWDLIFGINRDCSGNRDESLRKLIFALCQKFNYTQLYPW